MKHHTSLFSILVIIAGSSWLSAATLHPDQKKDSGAPSFSVKVDTSVIGKTGVETGGVSAGDVAVSKVGVELTQPLPPLGDNFFPSVGLSYTTLFLDLGAGTALPERLHTVSVPISVFKTFDEKWSGLASVSPDLSNAGTSFSREGFGVSFFTMATYSFSETLRASFGLAGDTMASGFGALLPVVAAEWKFATDWTLNVGFPSTGISWQATDKLKLSAKFLADFGTFYVEEDPLPGLLGKPSLKDTKLDYMSISVGLGADYKLTNSLTVGATVGALIYRKANYDSRNYELSSEGSAAYFGLSAAYAF